MRLTDLEPHFLKILDERTYQYEGVAREEADGIDFLCPKCFAANGGAAGTHHITCWQPHVPQTFPPTPGRWPITGAGMEDISLNPSVFLTGPGCGAHFFVRNGAIEMC